MDYNIISAYEFVGEKIEYYSRMKFPLYRRTQFKNYTN